MDSILPADADPGAEEANAIAYADWYLAQPEFVRLSQCCTMGLALLDEVALATYDKAFLSCASLEREMVLQKVQGVPHPTVQEFFVTLIRLTLGGFLCPPSYGGNRDGMGWKYIGFSPQPGELSSPTIPPSHV